MGNSLVKSLGAAFDDPTTAGVVIQHDLVPLAGPGAPVASPTYLDGQRPEAEGYVPLPDEAGWLNGLVTGEDGRPVTARSVVLDSVASQSGRAESALWERRHVFGGLPGFVMQDAVSIEQGTLPVAFSSWQTSHRHVDAWFKFAAESGQETPLWVSGGRTQELLASINSTEDAGEAFAYAPNALLYGFWLSSGVVRRHRQARVYSSEVIGWGAQQHYGGASKIEPLPVSKETEVDVTEFGLRRKGKGTGKPSEAGFGMVPSDVKVLGYSCERIAARASLSLTLLRNMSYGEDPDGQRRRAASVALLVLGLAGDALARQDTTLRSGCDLVPAASRWGLQVAGKASPEPLTMDHPQDEKWWAEQMTEALRACEQVGLGFAEPVQLELSAPQQRILTDAARNELASAPADTE